LQGYLEQARL